MMKNKKRYIIPLVSVDTMECVYEINQTSPLKMDFNSYESTEEALSNGSSGLWDSDEWNNDLWNNDES